MPPDRSPLDLRIGPQQTTLQDVSPGTVGVTTQITFAIADGCLRIEAAASDAEMLELVATAPSDATERYLYEEDVMQYAIILDPTTNAIASLLVNPQGKRAGAPASAEWTVCATRHATGWRLVVDVPIAASTTCVGLSLHRFFRGIRGQISAFGCELPHPLQPADFRVLILAGDGDAVTLAADFRATAQATVETQTQAAVDAIRARLAAVPTPPQRVVSLDLATAMAEQRATFPVKPGTGHLCWNEGHFQNALLDLYALTDDRRWVDIAASRIDAVWALRGSVRGLPDSLWKRPLPVWYNELETGTACTLTTGVILRFIARLMRTIWQDDRLADLRDQVTAWIPYCHDAVALHAPEWVDFPDGSGMHLEPYHKGPRRVYPDGGSRVNPLNREYAFSQALLDLWHVTGRAEYRQKVEKAARYFRRTSEWGDGLCLWEYEVMTLPALGEDVDHASCQVWFAEHCHANGIEFMENDLRQMAATLESRLLRHGDVPCGFIRGSDPGLHLGVAAWASLCRFVPDTMPRITAVIEAGMHEDHRIFTPDSGWGLRLITIILGARGDARP